MSKVERVLIVGGGIGGLCAAIGLARAGIDCEIVEIKTDWTVYGVGIIQPSNQLRALDEIGLAKACIEHGAAFLGWEICDDAGRAQTKVPTPKLADAYPPINGIPRPVLHDILTAEAARVGAKVRLGLTVEEIENPVDEACVRFSDGSSGGYDLVIGADGTYSKVRKLVFGSETVPVFNGLSVWRYNFPRPADMVWGSVYYGRRAKAGLVPMSRELMYMFVVSAEPGNPRMPKEHMHEAMRQRLAGFTGIIGRLREDIVEPRGVVYRPMEPMLLPLPWHRGRVVLIGDAVHSATPQLNQGASIAIEDAVLLAALLAKDRPLDDILREFSQRRFERCRFVVDTSLQLGRWELAEFEGRPDPSAQPPKLMSHAAQFLAQPY
jgi:2-polyprenyl-6-methoxyphenol hydroxylase-like FAD-dependent oxidoreductase